MISWFARNDVAANLLLAAIVLSGLYSLFSRIPLEIFPSVQSNIITIRVSLRGASPEDVEQSVAIRIEEAVYDLEGIEQITSRSTEGSASVSIEVEQSYDARDLLNDVKSRVDAINTFPVEAEKPIIALAMRKREVISVAVSGDYSEREIREYAEKVRDDLSRIDGITQIDLTGIRRYEIAVEVSNDQLRNYELSLSDIANAIRGSSLDISAGNIRTEGGDVFIRSKGQAYRKNEFENIVIKTNPDGSIIRLTDIATINDGFEESALRTRFNGKLGALLEVFRVGDQSAIDVANKVKDYIEQQQANLPQGIELTYWDDDSQIVKNRLSTLSYSALQGSVLVILLLSLFLRPMVAIWVFVGVPVSFMGAFLLMPILGVTLNIITLFAFILVLGIVVDDAIVTGENIYSHLQNAEDGLSAAISGTKEVAVPVTFGVLTTVAAFLPLGFIEGDRGPVFAMIPAVVVPVLLFSLIESKLVLPAHLKHVQLRKDTVRFSRLSQFQQNFADGFEQFILRYYQPTLRWCLSNRISTLVMFIGVLAIIVTMAVTGFTKFIFFPRISSETIRVTLDMPEGTAFAVTDTHVQHIARQAEALQEKYIDPELQQSVITNIYATTSPASGRVRFEIIPPEKRSLKINSQDLAREWRRLIGPIPGADNISFRAEIGRSSDPIDVRLYSNDIATLENVSELVKERLATYPTVFDINDSQSQGKQELLLNLNSEAVALGMTRSAILQQVRQAFFGIEAQRIQRGRDDIRVMVRLPLNERVSVADLEQIMIRGPNNRLIPLSNIAELTSGSAPSTIYRVNRQRTISVTADVDKANTNMTVLAADLSDYLDELLLSYPAVSYSLEGEAREQSQSFGSLLWGLVFVLFAIYCLLAIPFKSYIQPLIVMSVIPFGAIGAMIGHWVMSIMRGETMHLSIMSIFGLLALIGVVVNDSLVLVDYINKHKTRSKELRQAILNAGTARFRPVMLTSLTTFLGLTPLLFEKSTQAQFLIPMAVSLGFGIIFATFITLLLVPVNYSLVEDGKRLTRKIPEMWNSYKSMPSSRG